MNQLAASCALIGRALQQSPPSIKAGTTSGPWPVLPPSGVTLDSAYGACGWGRGTGFSTGLGRGRGTGLSTCTVDCEASAPLCAACTPGESRRHVVLEHSHANRSHLPHPPLTTPPHLHTITPPHPHTITPPHVRTRDK